MEKKPVRRVVTGHDADGKAVILIDQPTPYVNQRGEGNVACPLIAIGEFGGVHHQNQRAAGENLFAAQFHVHREDGFERLQ